jgi:quinohemoprotein ethanol dehydrogenase
MKVEFLLLSPDQTQLTKPSHPRYHTCGKFIALVLILCGLSLTALAQTSRMPEKLDWPFYGNDLANTRYQNADQINLTNVSQLKPAWVFHTGVLDPEASLEVSPIVVNGTMFVTSGHDDVYALNGEEGELKWAYHPTDMPPFSAISICCGRDNRGVAAGGGNVFLARLDDVLVALNAKSGTVAWKATVADYTQGYAMTIAPQYINGTVVVGLAGGEFTTRGQIVAYNGATGQELWRYYTTQPGTWADTSYLTGGASIWTTASADPTLGLVYFGTGNAAPDLNGILRAGQNFYTVSLIALDVTTGNLVWAFQETHHDLWDYDATQPTMLFNVTLNGTTYPALGECAKNGNYYVLDRRNGQPIYPVTEVPVPTTEPAWQNAWPTQPSSAFGHLTPLGIVPGTVDTSKLPAGVVPAPEYTPPSDTVSYLIQPGTDGGCEWPPAAYSPRTGYIYYGARYEPNTFTTSQDATTGFGSESEGVVPGVTDYGIFGATDTATGNVIWTIQVPQPAKSGMLVAGDLAFFGEGNGKFHGVNAATGQMLWTFDGTTIRHGGGAQAAPIAYVLDGREYIVNAFGGNVEDRDSYPPNPVGDAIVAFALPHKH